MTKKQKQPSCAQCLPWNDLMALAFGYFKIPPAQFWASTPLELKATFEGGFGSVGFEPPSKDGLDDLMKQFPDISVFNQADKSVDAQVKG